MYKTKLIIMTALLAIGSLSISAQGKVEIVPLCGYNFQSNYYGYDGRIEFSDGLNYGGQLNIKPNEMLEIGFVYLHQDATADVEYYYADYGQNSKQYGLETPISYYMLSLVRDFYPTPDKKVVPYMGLDLGMAQINDKEYTGNYFRFAVGLKAGLKYQINDKISIRVQPQLECPVEGFGVGVGVGTGGASVGATTYSSFVQFGIMGGLGFSF